MIEFHITIEEQPDGSVKIDTITPGGPATLQEVEVGMKVKAAVQTCRLEIPGTTVKMIKAFDHLPENPRNN